MDGEINLTRCEIFVIRAGRADGGTKVRHPSGLWVEVSSSGMANRMARQSFVIRGWRTGCIWWVKVSSSGLDRTENKEKTKKKRKTRRQTNNIDRDFPNGRFESAGRSRPPPRPGCRRGRLGIPAPAFASAMHARAYAQPAFRNAAASPANAQGLWPWAKAHLNAAGTLAGRA